MFRIVTFFIITLGIGGLIWLFINKLEKTNQASPEKDKLAKCLTEKNVVMYGAYWCPHCQNQKKLFGDSFKYVIYVECTQEIKRCEENKIEGYPTWIFSDGSRLSGEVPLKDLAQKATCNYLEN